MKRNGGIDILKVLAMFFIIILHINLQGGLIKFYHQGSLEYNIIMFLEVIAIVAVNIYGIASGYLSYSSYENKNEEKYNYKRIINLWFEVVFYSVVISLIFEAFGCYHIGKREMIAMFLPVSTKYLWYFTAYFLLFFFMPMINSFVKNAKNKFLITSLIFILCLFSMYQSLVGGITNFTYLNDGYSVWWLFILFYIGAIIKKVNLFNKVSSKKLIISLIFLYIISYAGKIVIPYFDLTVFEDVLFVYTSITNVLIGIIYVILFSRIKFSSSKLATLAGATFGVYAIHLHPAIWAKIHNAFTFILKMNIFIEPLLVILIGVLLYVILLSLDILRSKLFKLIRIDKLAIKLDELINKIVSFILKKVDFED